MNLFQRGNFVLHSREYSPFKIECDVLTDEDYETCAMLIVDRVAPFCDVYGVPKGGTPLAKALKRYITLGNEPLPTLIVDDVWTTGASMRGAYIAVDESTLGPRPIGATIFARSVPESWVTPLFQMTPTKDQQ